VRTVAIAAIAFLAGALTAADPGAEGLFTSVHSEAERHDSRLEAASPAWAPESLLEPAAEAQMMRACAKLERGLRAAGWPETLVPTMLAVARAESGCQHDAVLETFRERSIGPLQINVRAHPWVTPWCARDHVCASRAALVIARRQGLRAWTSYRTGEYRRWFR
jgi:hypothetical protein